MRIAVTGAGGQLGRELTRSVPDRGHVVIPLTLGDCDITDPRSVRAALERTTPDVIVNCAGWTAVDAAEEHRSEAELVNARGPAVLAGACAELGARLCQLSTDFVFDGTATMPIDETAPPHPISAYGASKLAGEEAVRDALPDGHVIVRTSWLYGSDGPNFVLTILRLARERGALRVVADQIGSPTWTGHLAPAILRLLELGAGGTFHLTNSGETSWRGFAVAIMAGAGLDVPVEAITTNEYPTPARRPPYSVLDNRRWRELGETPLPEWRDGLASYLRGLSRQ
jgi:dTDP-4-dehydrorhamnose reductase